MARRDNTVPRKRLRAFRLGHYPLTLSQLRSDLTHEKAITRLALDKFETDGQHLKESIESRFDVLLTRLDSKIAAFENRKPGKQSKAKSFVR